MQIDIGGGIPHDLKKILGKKMHFPNSFEWIQSEWWFWNYLVANIFYAPSNDKRYGRKKKYIYIYIYTQSNMLY